MRQNFSDRLWPVLTVLVLLLAGATAIELTAGRYRAAATVISISASGFMIDEEASIALALGTAEPVDENHALARGAAQRGDIATALILFDELATAHPRHAGVYAEYGLWLLIAGKAHDAREQLEQAAKLADKDATIALGLGKARQRTGDLDGAIQAFQRALELRAEYADALAALGSAYEARGDIERAISAYEQAILVGDTREKRTLALVALGRCYVAAERRDQAMRSFETALERTPGMVPIRIEVATGYLMLRDAAATRRAIEILEDTAALAPDMPQVHHALSRALEQSGDSVAAERALLQAIRLDPGYRSARRRLLDLALERQDFATAREQVEQLLAQAPDAPEHHFLAGLVAARQEHVVEARAHYQRAITSAGGYYPEAYFNLGILERSARNVAGAIAAYRRAIELRPDYYAAMNNLGLVYQDAERMEEAEATFRSLLRARPEYAAAWLNYGQLLGRQDRFAEAITAIEKALAVDPDYPAARRSLGSIYRRAGKYEQAAATYRALVEASPRYVSAWFDLGVVLVEQGKREEAIQAFTRALELDPEHVPSLRRMAELNLAAGRVDEARNVAQSLLDQLPNDQEAHLLMAEIARRSGDRSACRKSVELVLVSSPAHQQARQLQRQCIANRI